MPVLENFINPRQNPDHKFLEMSSCKWHVVLVMNGIISSWVQIEMKADRILKH